MDGVKIGFGMFIVLPILLLVTILFFILFGIIGGLVGIAILFFILILYFVATKYKGEDIVAKKKK